MEINCYPYKENPKKTTIYSYFHDTIEAARQDAYSEAVAWPQLQLNLIVDTKATQKLKETQRRLQMSTSMISIIKEKCNKATTHAARINSERELAMAKMIATTEKLPGGVEPGREHHSTGKKLHSLPPYGVHGPGAAKKRERTAGRLLMQSLHFVITSIDYDILQCP